jgi:hypothetical protein
MKKTIFILLTLVSIKCFSQKPPTIYSGSRFEATEWIKLKNFKITGISGDSTGTNNRSDFAITEAAAKGYVRSIKDTTKTIAITKSLADTAIKYGKLIKGAFYRISGTHTALYNDGTNSGTTIILQAIDSNKFSTAGKAIFYNPKYSQLSSTVGFGVWFPYSTWTCGTVTGFFNANELITANNGATGQLVAVAQSNLFIPLTGTWTSGVTSVTGNVTGATATVSAISVKTYSAGAKVIWGGYSWTNLTGAIGSANNIVTLDATNWSKNVYDTANYNIAVDEIEYDYSNDWITKRHEVLGNNTVVCTKSNFTGFAPTYHPIAVFQWGNPYTAYTSPTRIVGMGNNTIENSYVETVDFRGAYFFDNRVFNNSTVSGNYFLGVTGVYSNKLDRATITGNYLTTFNSVAALLNQNTAEQGASITNNIGNFTITDNLMYKAALISGNISYATLNIAENKLFAYSNQQCQINTNKSTGTSANAIMGNIIYNGSINTNWLQRSGMSSSLIITNTIQNNGHIDNNNFTSGSSISFNYVHASSVTFDSLTASQISNNIIYNAKINNDTLSVTNSHINNNKFFGISFVNKKLTATTPAINYVFDSTSLLVYKMLPRFNSVPDTVLIMDKDTVKRVPLSLLPGATNLGNADLTNSSGAVRHYDNNYKNLYFDNTGLLRISRVMANYGMIYDFNKTLDLNNYDSLYTTGINAESGTRLELYWRDKNNKDTSSGIKINTKLYLYSKDTIKIGTADSLPKVNILPTGVMEYTKNNGSLFGDRSIPDKKYVDSAISSHTVDNNFFSNTLFNTGTSAISMVTPNDVTIHYYSVGTSVNITARSGSTLTTTIEWTYGGVTKTTTLYNSGSTTAGISTIGFSSYPVIDMIPADPNTTIYIRYTVPSGTIAFDAAGHINRIQ